jgi:hypothetical protein
MATTTGYTRLPEPTRQQVRTAARSQAQNAARRYADLLAAEAGVAARAVYPRVGLLAFRLTDDIDGPSATLVAAYTADGRRLWHNATGREWPDESLVTDHLAAAAHWCDDYFTPAGGDDLFLLDLD